MKICAKYVVYSFWDVPSSIFLLSEEENKKAKDGSYGSWYVHWDILHYFDKDLIEREIEPEDVADSDSKKRPEEIMEIE